MSWEVDNLMAIVDLLFHGRAVGGSQGRDCHQLQFLFGNVSWGNGQD